MIAGPVTTCPGGRSGRHSTGVSTYPSPASKQTGSRGPAAPAGASSARAPRTAAGSPGAVIGPIPETRRLTHSTCCGAVAGEVVAVERPVLGVEPAGDRRRAASASTARRAPRPGPRRPARSSAGRRCGRTGARSSAKPSLSQRRARPRRAGRRTPPARSATSSGSCEGDVGLHVVVLDVDGEQPERRHVAGVGRHQHGREPEDVDQPAQQQRAGAAERGQREVADVEPALDGDLAQRVGLVPGRDLEHAGGAGLGRQAELGGERLDARPRRGGVERDLAAEQVGRDPAEHDVRVGDGDLGAARA